MAQPNNQRIVMNMDDYIFDYDFKEGVAACYPVVISSDSEQEVDRDASPCPSPPPISPQDSDDEDYVPGTPDCVPETPVDQWPDSDEESVNLPIAEDNVPPPSPEFGGSSPEL